MARSCYSAACDPHMTSLEAKVPPPLVAIVVVIAMWGVSRVAGLLHIPEPLRLGLPAAFLVVGICFTAGGLVAFRRARTTVNPNTPERASSLVNSGIYRITRNPMYVGLLFVLLAWAVYLSCAWALIGPVLFVLYIQRFQIVPEERALGKLFGPEYAGYKANVRRWL
jgi:protein-S-isoprenylcysteine O-methyltransferase Ste14